MYSNKGEKEVWTTATEIDLRYGFIYGGMNRIEYNYHFKYIDIPLKINYIFTSKRMKFFVSTGVSSNVFLRHMVTQYLEAEDGSTSKNRESDNEDIKAVNFSLMLGVGADYELKSGVNLRLEPEFRHSISSIVDAPIKQNPYSLGMNVGVFMLLK